MTEAASAGPQLLAMGDRALVVEYGRALNAITNARVRACAEYLLAHPLPGMTDVVPAYAALTVYFDPLRVVADHRTLDPMGAMREALLRAIAKAPESPKHKVRTVEIPVCYGGEFGEDLDDVARRCEMTPEEVIKRHAKPLYEVHMLGFVPGFAYLGGLDRSIATARRDSPRKRIPAGSVGIGGEQTGVYPFATPGGWNLIGRTPLVLFRIDADPPVLMEPGDRVRFVPVSREAFDKLRSDAGTTAGRQSPPVPVP